MLTKACQYGIKSLIFISASSIKGQRVTVKEVAEAIDSPPAFTSKILQKLVAAQIIHSIKGSGGGFYMEFSIIQKIKIMDIVEAIEGTNITSGCFLGLHSCSDRNPCPVHHFYGPLRQQMNDTLLNVTLYDIVSNDTQHPYYLRI